MTDPPDSALHYPLGDALPAAGRTLDVAPGVRWLRMPLPFALDHINLWLLRDEIDGVAGWTIVDCGVANDATRQAWQRIFASELQGLPVLRVIVTHMHPDHLGLAHWLCERWTTAAGPGARECRLWMSATDWNVGRLGSQRGGFDGDGAASFYARHGLVDEQALAQVRARSDYFPSLVPQVPARFRRLMDGMVLAIGGRDWHCITGYGHAPEHIALHCPATGTLISGDMVLPRISTNVSVFHLEPEGNPLPLYLRSIAALRSLPAHTCVLPSHGKPFTGLHARIEQLRQHHDDRLAEVMAACIEAPCSAADLLPLLFRRRLDLHQTTFAMGEAIAHLHALEAEGRLSAQPGDDGVLRFRCTQRAL
ncbi:MAG: Zn-dependent hydrolase [Leptothrix sp. (in: Bacteria)]|nr:Zn-dependent hydrolase [Leptothrix sp. (in: b-proteobacteria)]